ncbi:MAG: sigma-70 family RNA polymerase sigma factor [Acidobacteriia bacterium]|nr:sigma-70 family RNA polymerase sigma factor [Terriglobia bacterium]
MDPRKLSTQELVQLCLDSKDEASWTEFVRRFQPLIAGVVTKYVRHRTSRVNPDLIDDLIQETYLKLCANDFKPLRTFDFRHDNAFFGFLKVVASHVVEDYFRRPTPDRPGREEEDIETLKIAIPSKHGIDPAELEILFREVNQCLNEHASDPNFTRDHTIFWLYYRQGFTAKAISQLPGIGLGVKGVESTLVRLTGMLRARLAIPRKRRASGG